MNFPDNIGSATKVNATNWSGHCFELRCTIVDRKIFESSLETLAEEFFISKVNGVSTFFY